MIKNKVIIIIIIVQPRNNISKMCNELKCAIQSTVGLININITRDVQDECANRLYRVCTHSSNADDGEWWVLQFIKLSPVDVMILSLGAWWPEGRSSFSVSQFLPSHFWSACPMAAEWKDGYRGDLSPWLFLQLCFCSVCGRCPDINQHIRMISEGSCDTEYWSNDDENSALNNITSTSDEH